MSNASSPCIGVCTIDERLALCLGCGRSIDEIVGWSALSEPQRLAVMAELPGRLAIERGPALDADPRTAPQQDRVGHPTQSCFACS